MHAGLPKWPQMLVTGTTLPAEQALEIIRRTDHFFLGYSGNNYDFVSKARKLCYLPEWPDRDSTVYRSHDGAGDFDLESFHRDFQEYRDRKY